MTDKLTVSAVFPVAPQEVFEAWLSGRKHGAMTGSPATTKKDGSFTAWEGYIQGKTVKSKPFTLIDQTWRSTDFPDGAPDSKLSIKLAPVKTGTKVTLVHTAIPKGQGKAFKQGWKDFYFTPMKAYFEK